MNGGDLTLSVDEVRSLDAAAIEELGIPGLVLMENAARGIVDVIERQFPDDSTIKVACGFGNNGGDGLALARLLAAEGRHSDIYLIHAERSLSSDAEANLGFLRQSQISVIEDAHGERFISDAREMDSQHLIVDCLLGTGVQGNPRAPYDRVIGAINDSPATVLAVDVPSGLNADTGEPGDPTVVANRTVTFAAMKQGFLLEDANHYTGPVDVAHIGLPAAWMKQFISRTRQS